MKYTHWSYVQVTLKEPASVRLLKFRFDLVWLSLVYGISPPHGLFNAEVFVHLQMFDCTHDYVAHSAGVLEYTDCNPAEG